MTDIDQLHVLTRRQLEYRDWYTVAVTLAAVASIGYVFHVVTPENKIADTQAVVTGDALKIAAYICRRNDGVRMIEPDVDGRIRFRCRDGAEFLDVVVSLR